MKFVLQIKNEISVQLIAALDFNPIQAGVFYSAPPFFLYLFSNYHQIWHDSSLK